MTTPILELGDYVIVSLPEALTDSDWRALRDDLLRRVGKRRSRGAVIDVAALDVMDSYATRLLDGIARMIALRGADTVVVGLQPEVAFAMAQLGLRLSSAGTALDLEEGLALLQARHRGARNAD